MLVWGFRRIHGACPWKAQLRTAFRVTKPVRQEHAELPVDLEYEVSDTLKVAALVQRFRSRGHLVAQLDPLKRVAYGPWMEDVGVASPWSDEGLTSLLEGYEKLKCGDRGAWLASKLQLQGRTDSNRQGNFNITCRQFSFGESLFAGNPADQKHWTLPEIVERMRAAYCDTLAVEFDHLPSQKEQQWIAQRVEQAPRTAPHHQQQILHDLLVSDAFEGFLGSKFPNNKRFGIEGCEALLPALRALISRCARHGIRHVEIGMPHRGRLNVLSNILQKPAGLVFGELAQAISEFHVGDVQYHQGQSATLTLQIKDSGSHEIRVGIAPNPSHLEAVNTVVQGMMRAEQDQLRDGTGATAVALLIHGDAAFAGLGIVAECLQLSNLPGYSTGGSLHVVINNQMGFTTPPSEGRSSPHPTSMAKAIGAPIFHVNADDPEAVVRACCLAADWRAAFHRDVVVDLVGYRRYGHNELDEPKLTLPFTHALIDQHKPVLELYAARLEQAGIASKANVTELRDKVEQDFADQYTRYEEGHFRQSAQAFIGSSWQGAALQAVLLEPGHHSRRQEPTGLPLPTLQWVGRSLCNVPKDFTLHPQIASLVSSRRLSCSGMVEEEASRVSFAMAEALAFGTLALHRGLRPPGADEAAYQPADGLNRGAYSVRMSGQDSQRGTFNQRHHVLVDQLTGRKLVPLDAIAPDGGQETVSVLNSPLNEAAVLGFEYGYSLASCGRTLTVWEAQFGDFCNNAQAMIDQFIAAAEERWGQQSGLVLMLPHGLEGQGPDHSSARVERFLQLCNDDPDHLPGNSPAQRRQVASTFAALAREHGGSLNKQQVLDLVTSTGIGKGQDAEAADLLWGEMGLAENAHITEEVWDQLMVQYARRNAERHANMFICNVTTPAQMFHVLRRQMNRPFHKPLVLLTPKFLLHHRPATSALSDFATGTYFNRVIDDSKASDNTRHRARHPQTGKPHLVPPDEMRRVVLCSGAIYYQLSAARRSRRISDIALVRLEQLSPFPHDLLLKAIVQYKHSGGEYAEVVWCQEEPKNQGAWRYVKSRLECTLRELLPGGYSTSALRYVGRPVAASPATASVAIHKAELKEIIDAALTLP